MGIRHRRDLCGLFTGVPLTERHVEDTGRMPDVILIFREGIFDAAMNRRRGRATEQSLKRQIRITVLHEIGHHFGLREEDLRQLGYQ